jgi:hypothetical protein
MFACRYCISGAVCISTLIEQQNNLPPTAVNQKHPGFGRFSPSPFERRPPPPHPHPPSRSVELKTKTRNLIA